MHKDDGAAVVERVEDRAEVWIPEVVASIVREQDHAIGASWAGEYVFDLLERGLDVGKREAGEVAEFTGVGGLQVGGVVVAFSCQALVFARVVRDTHAGCDAAEDGFLDPVGFHKGELRFRGPFWDCWHTIGMKVAILEESGSIGWGQEMCVYVNLAVCQS